MSYNSVPAYTSLVFSKNPTFSNKRKDKSVVISAISTDESVMISGEDSEKYSQYREKLRRDLAVLKEKAHEKIINLTGVHLESFDSIANSLNILQASETEYPDIYRDVVTYFNDDKDTVKGTVKAFFLNCFISDKQKGVVGCNPKCITGHDTDRSTCEDLVFLYQNKSLTRINDKQTEHAYVFIQDKSFKGFTDNHINEIKNANVKNVTLVTEEQDTPVLTVEELPKASNETGVVIGWVVFIIILFIVIAVALYLISNKSVYRMRDPSYGVTIEPLSNLLGNEANINTASPQ